MWVVGSTATANVSILTVSFVPYEEGLSDWRVYCAEEAVGHDRDVTVEECQRLVDEATASTWWHEWFPDTAPIEVVEGGDETPELHLISSYAAHYGYPRPTKWLISLHPKMLTARVLLHELAHCVAPSYVVEEVKTPRSRRSFEDVMYRRKHLVHGGCFTAALAVITDNMLPGDDGQLATAFAHYEAPIAPQDDLRTQLAGQPAVLDEQEAFYAEVTRRSAEADARYVAEHGQAPPVGAVPSFHWGLHIEMMRRDRRRRENGRLISQRRVAEAISEVMPCSARHISKLENSRERPDDPTQLKRAMLATIFIGIDPIWTRYNLRLTRWECGDITMEQARVLNPDWAELVDHINQLLHQMPPRWHVEGTR